MPSSRPAHVAQVTHVGSFAHARCETCEWVGAGRRAIRRARLDAEAHELLGPSAPALRTIDQRDRASAIGNG